MTLRSVLAFALLGALVVPFVARGDDSREAIDRFRETVEASPTPTLDTVLALTNLNAEPSRARLQAFYRDGSAAGEIELEIPGNGLALALASDFPRPEPAPQRFIGTVKVRAGGHVVGTALLAGGPLTDLPALNEVRRIANSASPRTVEQVSSIVFPVVAAY